jgi:hypothetical protein
LNTTCDRNEKYINGLLITLNTYHRTGGGIAMYKIVVDSCGELPEELKKDGHFETVSLELEVDG